MARGSSADTVADVAGGAGKRPPSKRPGASPAKARPEVETRPSVDESPDGVPRPIRLAVGILALEALGGVALAGWLLVLVATSHSSSIGRALLDAVGPLIVAVVLALCARGLYRLSGAARTPVVVLQLLGIPVSYSLAFQAGKTAIGAPILIAVLAVLYLLFTPPAREALDREPPGGGRVR